MGLFSKQIFWGLYECHAGVLTQITEVPFVIGSGSDVDFPLPAVGGVYPEHCEIDITESGEASLKNLDPNATVFINGESSNYMPLESQKNYLVQIGNSTFLLTGSPKLDQWASAFAPDTWECMDGTGQPLEPMTSMMLSQQVAQGNLPGNTWITFNGIEWGEAVMPLSRLLDSIEPTESSAPQTPAIQDDTLKIPDKGQYRCPNCIKRFEDAMWIATHEDLRPDPVLKETEHESTFMRFFPDASNLMPDGTVKDAMGSICSQMACPHCRLTLPPGYLLTENQLVSIVGDAASGKSYFLTVLTKRLPEILLRNFSVNLTDLDPRGNIPINTMANQLFSGGNSSEARLLKTDLEGHMYQDVHYNGKLRKMPRPFTFSVSSDNVVGTDGHSLTFYDNAGEHFQPGMDTEDRPGAKHVGMASGILFLFDPFNSNDFRRVLGESDDPQIKKPVTDKHRTMLDEMYARMQKRRNLSPGQKVDSPLAVVIGKYDAWNHRYGEDLFRNPLEDCVVNYNLPYGEWILGSGDGSHIQVDMETISPQHVKISLTEEAVVITDLSNTFGTLLDGIPLQANIPTPVRPEMKIKLCNFTLVLKKNVGVTPDAPQYRLKLIKRLPAINQEIVDANSHKMRSIMMEISPSVIASAEKVSRHIRYFPVSCFGHNAVDVGGKTVASGTSANQPDITVPGSEKKDGLIGPDPKKLDPYMVEVPILWMLSILMPECVPSLEESTAVHL